MYSPGVFADDSECSNTAHSVSVTSFWSLPALKNTQNPHIYETYCLKSRKRIKQNRTMSWLLLVPGIFKGKKLIVMRGAE